MATAADTTLAKDILGHSSVTTTMTIYAHAIEEQTSPRAAQVMDEALRRS